MSLAQHVVRTHHRFGEHDIQRCVNCTKHYPESYGYNNQYCREICKYRAKAASILTKIRHNHEYCASCYRELKEVEPPKPANSPNSVWASVSPSTPVFGRYHSDLRVGGRTGKEKPRPGYDWGIGEQFDTTDPVHNEWSIRPVGEATTKVCECGVSHHATVDYLVRKLSKQAVVERTKRLVTCLDESGALENHDKPPTEYDTDILFAYVKKAKTEQRHEGHARRLFRRGLALAIREAE